MDPNDVSGPHALRRDDNPINEWQPGQLAHSSDYFGLKGCRNRLGHVAQRAPVKGTIPMLPIIGL